MSILPQRDCSSTVWISDISKPFLMFYAKYSPVILLCIPLLSYKRLFFR